MGIYRLTALLLPISKMCFTLWCQGWNSPSVCREMRISAREGSIWPSVLSESKRKHFKMHKYFAWGNFLLILALTPLSDASQHFKPARGQQQLFPRYLVSPHRFLQPLSDLRSEGCSSPGVTGNWTGVQEGLNKDVCCREAPFPRQRKPFLTWKWGKFSANILLQCFIIKYNCRVGLDSVKRCSKDGFGHLVSSGVKTEQHLDKEWLLGTTQLQPLAQGDTQRKGGVPGGSWYPWENKACPCF